MFRSFLRVVTAGLVLLPIAASAEPITLKLAYFSSDRSVLYQAGVKPFVDAVNNAAEGLIRIEVYFSSALGPVDAGPKLLLDGAADIAFMIPGYTPDVFYDDSVVELPGLFRDAGEATLVYARLAARNAFKSYANFVVLGSFASEPESVHSRRPIASIKDLNGQKIRVNNVWEAAALEKLGAVPVLLPINKTAEAISRGTLDGAMSPPAMLFEFGIGRATTNHYMLRTSAALMLLAMSRKKFDSLPAAAQTIIRKYGGQWAAAHYVEIIEKLNASVLDQLRSDPRRKLILPNVDDQANAQRAFDRVSEEWTRANADRRHQLELLQAELATLRAQSN